MGKGTRGLAVGTLLAGIAGYIAGVLTAPKSGRETRHQIRTTASSSVLESERQLKQLHTELSELIQEGKRRAAEFGDQADRGYHEAIKTSEVTRRKLREILSAVHEGDTEDKDLQRAVKEAAKAVRHLKSYLKK